MKVKLLTILTIFLAVVVFSVGIPPTSARILIEGGGDSTTPVPTTTTPSPTTTTAPTPTTTTTPTTTITPAPTTTTTTSWWTSPGKALDDLIMTMSDVIKAITATVVNLFTIGSSKDNKDTKTTTTAPGNSYVEKIADASGVASYTVNWSAVNVSDWSASGPGLSRSGGAVGSTAQQFTSGLITNPPGTYIYTINGGNGSKSATITIFPTPIPPLPTPPTETGDGNNGTTNGTGGTSGTNGAGGAVQSATCTVSANPKTVVLPDSSTVLTWSCDRAINGCAISDNNPNVADIGPVNSSGDRQTPIVGSATKFTLQCPSAPSASVTVGLFNPYLKEVVPQ